MVADKRFQPVLCTDYQSQVIEKKKDLDARLTSLFDSINKNLQSIIEQDLNPSQQAQVAKNLEQLNSELGQVFVDSSLLNLLDGHKRDRKQKVIWDLRRSGLDLQKLSGTRIQLEFIQLGNFYWDPQWGLDIPSTLASVESISTFGSQLIPYGIGRVGANGLLEMQLQLSPEESCLLQKSRILVRFPDLVGKPFLALEANLQ